VTAAANTFTSAVTSFSKTYTVAVTDNTSTVNGVVKLTVNDGSAIHVKMTIPFDTIAPGFEPTPNWAGKSASDPA
jgi:hypothetical protein